MSVLRSIGVSTIANATGQVAQLAFIPVVTRLVTPQAYGLFMVFQMSAAVGNLLAGLQYHSAIVVCDNRRQALAVSALVAWLGLAVSALLGLAWAAGQLPVVPRSWDGAVATLLPLALFCFAGTWQRVGQALEVRAGAFRATALSGLANVVGMIATQFWLLKVMDDGVQALSWGLVAGQCASLLPLLPTLGRLWVDGPRVALSSRRLGWAARRHARFPRYMLLFALNGALRDRLVQMLVGAYTSASALGKLALAQRLIAAPQSLLHQGFSPVLYSFASANPRPATARVAAALIEVVFVVAAPLFMVVATELPALSALLLGGKWAGIETYIGWLFLPSLLLVSTSFVDKLFDAYGRQKPLMILETGYSVALLIGLALVCELGHADWAIRVYALVFTLYLLVCVGMAFGVNGLGMGRLLSAARWMLVCGAAFGALVYGIAGQFDRGPALAIEAAAYAVYLSVYAWRRGAPHLAALRAEVGR